MTLFSPSGAQLETTTRTIASIIVTTLFLTLPAPVALAADSQAELEEVIVTAPSSQYCLLPREWSFDCFRPFLFRA